MKTRTYLFIAFSVVAALVALFLAFQLAPWFYAINTRVRLYMDAPADTNVNICWNGAKNECLPLVPYSKINDRAAQAGEMADIWLGELPPRPIYFISLQFKSGVDKAKFHELELDSSNVFLQGYGKGNGAGVINLILGMNDFELKRVVPLSGDSSSFESKNNGFLIHTKGIISGPVGASSNWVTTIFIWALILSIFLWIVIPAFLLPQAIQNLGSADFLPPSPKYSWRIYFGCVAVCVVIVLLVVNSGVLLNQYDPMSYLFLATGGEWFNASRLLGYPLFLGAALFVSGYSLDGVILIQAVTLTLSVVFCLWTLRKWISPYVALPFVFFCLFSPAQVYFARFIMRESLFASLVLLGVTAVIAHYTSRKPYSDRWLIFFAVICGAAFLLRENGVILPFALLPVLALKIIKHLFSLGAIRERVRSVLLLLPLYLLPIVAIGTVYTVFGTYNYLHYGYFQIEEQQTSHGYLSKAMSPANFDVRGLLKPYSSIGEEAQSYLGWPLYSSYIVSRDQYPGADQTYATFYPSINAQMIERSVTISQSPVFRQANILNDIGKNVNTLVPWRAVLSGMVRQYIRVLYPDNQNDNHIYRLEKITNPDSVSYLNTLPVHVKMNFEEKIIGMNNLLADYYKVTERYGWYEVLFVLALLFSFYILKYKDPVFLAPMAVYLANCALVLYSRMVAARVFVNIDVLLVLQIALGLSLWLSRNSHIKTQELKS